ncbi:hypothetical protein GWI33_018749 [Rhynchophorus ferrugineus]|uniref:Uncharacterized protein n=1 Tax=Rhynchophorus ferrugineus TaxID=354439 RepID=A0A834HVB1_RHYFE|nr:hypothetical protein GWI33_018749 [Rhynchophorus ferrugineus]
MNEDTPSLRNRDYDLRMSSTQGGVTDVGIMIPSRIPTNRPAKTRVSRFRLVTGVDSNNLYTQDTEHKVFEEFVTITVTDIVSLDYNLDINSKKAPGSDLITRELLEQLLCKVFPRNLYI